MVNYMNGIDPRIPATKKELEMKEIHDLEAAGNQPSPVKMEQLPQV